MYYIYLIEINKYLDAIHYPYSCNVRCTLSVSISTAEKNLCCTFVTNESAQPGVAQKSNSLTISAMLELAVKRKGGFLISSEIYRFNIKKMKWTILRFVNKREDIQI